MAVDWFELYVRNRAAEGRFAWIHGMLSSKTRKGKVDTEIIEAIEEWIDVSGHAGDSDNPDGSGPDSGV